MNRYPPRKSAHHARVPVLISVATRAPKDGWTARRQAAFLAALAITGSVSEAARRVSPTVPRPSWKILPTFPQDKWGGGPPAKRVVEG